MAILRVCRKCKSCHSVAQTKCPKCGSRANSRDTFKVDVKYRGKRITRQVSSLKEARELEQAIKSSLVTEHLFGISTIKEKNDLTLSELFHKRFLPYLLSYVKNPAQTEGGIKGYFRKWINPLLGNKELSKITFEDGERLKNTLIKAGKSPRTTEQVLGLLKNILNRAVEWGYLKENPVKGVKPPRYDNKRTRFLTQDEAEALLQECKKRTTERNWIYQMVLLSLSTGMRAGEIFNLRWQDIDFTHDLIHIRDPKSGRSRTAYMSEEVKNMLLKQKERVDSRPSALVFPRRDGKPFTEVPPVFKNIVKDLGFNEGVTDPREKVCFHTLRHTFCSWLAIAGTPLHVIKELAGHSTIQMTERYAHLLPDVRREAIKKVWKTLKKE